MNRVTRSTRSSTPSPAQFSVRHSKREARLATGAGAPDREVLEIVALRAGSHPGMHTVGFDGPGESLQVRVEARDRSAYVAGAILSADVLIEQPERTGITAFTDLAAIDHLHHRAERFEIAITLNERLADAFFMTAKVASSGKTAVRFDFACTIAKAG